MDPFDDLLLGVRAEGALFDRSVTAVPDAPLRFAEGAALTLCVPLHGGGTLRGGSEERPLRVAETAIVRGPDAFTFSGNAVLLVGTYHIRREVPRRLLRVLPPLLVVPDGDACDAMRVYLEAQLAEARRPGRQIVLDRLLDWLLVCTLRDWFDQPEAAPPAWYRALADEVAGPALRAIHASPDRPWTLVSLAREAGVSRTTLAKRFAEVVGESPLAYLTQWRMTLAADLLADAPSTTVATVARRVGYADAFGFSAAFKRVRGVSPSEHRRADAERVDQP
ncbi:AraC family transcriptional regulator [Streptomyces sp. NPDC058001]|uniref:helix-turn-helix transcriptional regulator n=1 Tax=Streptomyces sp. NPDC058001 TaxID=3346300 RepID=UPI0036EBE475